MEFGLIVLSVTLFLYAITSKRLSFTGLTGPMVFASLGLILGPVGLEILDPLDPDRLGSVEVVALLLEATLVLVLFTDAMGVNVTRWRDETTLPGRLLGIGLPLTVAAGWGAATLLFTDLGVWEAGLVGVILAPTDAALGQAVVSNRRVPRRIRMALNVESGLNDGIALPVFFVFLEAALVAEAAVTLRGLVTEMAKEVLIAMAVGIVVGWAAAKLATLAAERDWAARGWGEVALLGVAFASWALGDGLGGSGFLAAWIAGLMVGRQMRERVPSAGRFSEDTGHVLTLLSFFVFGAYLLGQSLRELNWETAVYAVLSLTVIRMVPVAISMVRSGLRPLSVAYLGWFGPRGLASIILVATILEEAALDGAATIRLAMTITVGLSIYAHGITAWWGSNRYADWYEAEAAIDDDMAESEHVPDVPLSRRLGPPAHHPENESGAQESGLSP